MCCKRQRSGLYGNIPVLAQPCCWRVAPQQSPFPRPAALQNIYFFRQYRNNEEKSLNLHRHLRSIGLSELALDTLSETLSRRIMLCMSRKKILGRTAVMLVSATSIMVCVFMARYFGECNEQSYIAHGGGAIDGFVATNSLESVEYAIDRGVKYIELDLQLTSDGHIVAAHDWGSFNLNTYRDTSSGLVPTYDEFAACKIHGRYTPLTYEIIDSLFIRHPDIILVTDKIEDMEVLDMHLGRLKERMLVECFSPAQYDECLRLGYTPMRSYRNFVPGGLNVVKAGCARYLYQQVIPASYAVFDNRMMTTRDADSIFGSDARVRFVYVDEFE